MLEGDAGWIGLVDRQKLVGIDTEGGLDSSVEARPDGNEHRAWDDAVVYGELRDRVFSEKLLYWRRAEDGTVRVFVKLNLMKCLRVTIAPPCHWA